MPASATALRAFPFATSARSDEVVLSGEDIAAISAVLDAAQVELAILRDRIAVLEHEHGAGLKRAEAADMELAEALRTREAVTEALQEREHRMWSAEVRAQDCERQARTAEERATAAETREWEAKARLIRVHEALDEPTV